jgi:hypothetical protein
MNRKIKMNNEYRLFSSILGYWRGNFGYDLSYSWMRDEAMIFYSYQEALDYKKQHMLGFLSIV